MVFFTVCCFVHIHCSQISHLLAPLIELICQVYFPVCFPTSPLPRHWADWPPLFCAIMLQNKHSLEVVSAQHPQCRWALIKTRYFQPRIQWTRPILPLSGRKARVVYGLTPLAGQWWDSKSRTRYEKERKKCELVFCLVVGLFVLIAASIALHYVSVSQRVARDPKVGHRAVWIRSWLSGLFLSIVFHTLQCPIWCCRHKVIKKIVHASVGFWVFFGINLRLIISCYFQGCGCVRGWPR